MHIVYDWYVWEATVSKQYYILKGYNTMLHIKIVFSLSTAIAVVHCIYPYKTKYFNQTINQQPFILLHIPQVHR